MGKITKESEYVHCCGVSVDQRGYETGLRRINDQNILFLLLMSIETFSVLRMLIIVVVSSLSLSWLLLFVFVQTLVFSLLECQCVTTAQEWSLLAIGKIEIMIQRAALDNILDRLTCVVCTMDTIDAK